MKPPLASAGFGETERLQSFHLLQARVSTCAVRSRSSRATSRHLRLGRDALGLRGLACRRLARSLRGVRTRRHFRAGSRSVGKGGDQLIPVFLSEEQRRDHGEDLDEWRGRARSAPAGTRSGTSDSGSILGEEERAPAISRDCADCRAHRLDRLFGRCRAIQSRARRLRLRVTEAWDCCRRCRGHRRHALRCHWCR
ncbi:hypothetical protein ACVIM8_001615 [Bradyrhizobium sp. USDA 4529]